MSSDISQDGIIDVVEDFDYSTQNEMYNECFRKWRKNDKNPFAYQHVENKRERVYMTGRGFVEKSALEAEKSVLTRLFNVLGIAALMWLVMEDVAGRFFIYLLELLHLNIHYNFFDSSITGGSVAILIVLIISGVMKIIVPWLYVRLKMKMPLRLELMSRLNSPMALIGAISCTFIVCSALSVPVAYTSESKEIYQFFANIDADISVWGQMEFLVYMIFDVVIMSILNEFFLRGAMFSALRQFGDPFAIFTTAVIAALMTQDITVMPAAFVVSLVAGYGLVSSGTIFTAAAVHIVYKMYTLSLTMLEIDQSEKMPVTRNLFMIVTLIVGSVGLLVYWMTSVRSKRQKLALYTSELGMGKRIVHSFKTFPFSAVAILCIVYAVLKVVM